MLAVGSTVLGAVENTVLGAVENMVLGAGLELETLRLPDLGLGKACWVQPRDAC